MKILEAQSFIVLDYDADSNVHRLDFISDADEILANWGANTRISPVWSLTFEDVSAPKRPRKARGIAFIGPLNPAILETDFGEKIWRTFKCGKIWVSLGYFNVVALLADNDEFEVARELAERHQCSIELWELDEDGFVEFIPTYSTEKSSQPTISTKLFSAENFKNIALKTHVLEFQALTAATISRGAKAFPWLASDLQNITSAVQEFLPTEEASDATTPALLSRAYYDLSNVNAGLSRLVSQALSGTSPIMKTECHFWPHSLLGTAIGLHPVPKTPS